MCVNPISLAYSNFGLDSYLKLMSHCHIETSQLINLLIFVDKKQTMGCLNFMVLLVLFVVHPYLYEAISKF